MNEAPISAPFSLRRCLVIALLAFLCNPLPSYAEHDQRNPVQLTTAIQSEKYCKGDAEIQLLRMNLTVEYLNKGEKPVILQKRKKEVAQVIWVALDVDHAAKHDYELEIIPDDFGFNPLPKEESVIVKPGQSFKTPATVSIPVGLRGVDSVPRDSVSPGDYVLQIQVQNSDSLVSDPMAFKVLKDAKAENCN